MESRNNNPDQAHADFNDRRESVRRILGVGALAGGGALTGEWARPVVKAVVLPVHAQTTTEEVPSTEEEPSFAGDCSITVVCTNTYVGDITVQGSIAPAMAGVAVNLQFQRTSGTEFFEEPQPFGSTNTDGGGQYSVSRSGETVSFAGIRVIATLPDYPGAGEVVCTLRADDPGPHQADSSFYFCFYGGQSE